MLINPYSLNIEQNETKENITSDPNHIIKEISEHILNNFQSYIENNKIEAIKKEIRKLSECKYKISNVQKQNNIVRDVIDKIFGYGILQKYIDDIEVSDIRAVSHNDIYVKVK